jgi:iron(III) transport system substrate-binding protein
LKAWIAALASLGASIASGADSSLLHYAGPDRMERIVAAAKKEGRLTFYTTIAEKDLPVIIKPFEQKYGIAVSVWRAGTDKVLQRTLAENAAKRYDVDAIHFGSPEMEALARERVLQPVDSPVQQDLMTGSVPKHRQWTATILSVWVQAYNTQLVRKEDLPKSYRDLLDPKWKGKLGIESKNDDWFATVVHQMGGAGPGLAFFRELVAKNGLSPRHGHTLLTNMVVSGEVPLALTIYNYMPEQAKKKGAPIDWFAIEPAIARSNAIGIARHAPHPNAALLFYEYLLGPEGQAAMAGIDYVPTNTKVASPLKGVRIVQTDPIRTLDESPKWSKLFEDTVLGKGTP